MKKLLFTITGLLQVVLVMAQVSPVRSAATNSQINHAAQKAAAYNVNRQVAYQNTNKAWLIVDVDGAMPNGRIPNSKGIYEAMPEKPLQEK